MLAHCPTIGSSSRTSPMKKTFVLKVERVALVPGEAGEGTALKRALATYGPEEGFGEGVQRLLARAPTASARFLAGTRSFVAQAAEAEEAARLAEEEARHAAEAERKRKLEERLGNTLCFKDLDEEFTKQVGPILHMPVFVADSCMH